MDILKTIEELKTKYQDPLDAPQLAAWEVEAKRLLIVDSVAGSDAVKFLLEELSSQLLDMDKVLLVTPSTMLPDAQRDRLLDKKALYERVISYFDVEDAKEELQKQIDQN